MSMQDVDDVDIDSKFMQERCTPLTSIGKAVPRGTEAQEVITCTFRVACGIG